MAIAWAWAAWWACRGADAPDLAVSGAWARATPPGAANGVVFLTLDNPGDTDRAVVSASSPAADHAELHTHQTVDGTMQMRRIERIAVPAHGRATLAPGGDHVMLLGLRGPLEAGGALALTLGTDDGGSLVVTVPIADRAPDGG